MKCIACDTVLNNFEATRKTADDSYIDLCNACFTVSGIAAASFRDDLIHEGDYVIEEYDDNDYATELDFN
jgi:hypothetical protein